MRPLRRVLWPLVLTPLLALAWSAPGEPPPPRRGDRVVIELKERTLSVFQGEMLLRRFPISLAQGGAGKWKRGDGKNPVGSYRLMKGRASQFHRFLPVSYPNAEDARRGLEAGLITPAQAEAILRATRAGRMPPQDTALGGAIGVHGLGRRFPLGPLQRLHRLFNASEGCFVLTDEEVVELERLYAPGAVLEIR